jgi:hypothetical protein
MRKRRIASVAFTGAAIATGVGLHATTALAATSGKWTISPKSKPLTGTATATKLVDSTGASLTCGTAKATATLSKSTFTQAGNSLFKAGKVSGTFGSTNDTCTSNLLAAPFLATLKTGNLSASTYSANVTHGKITGVNASLKGTGVNKCTASFTGSVPYSYNNTTHVLTITGNASHETVTPTKSTSCAGLLAAGTKAYFSGAYTVAPAAKITRSPAN